MEKVGKFESVVERFDGLEFEIMGLVLEVKFRGNSGCGRRGAGRPVVLEFHDFPVNDTDEDFTRGGSRGGGLLVATAHVMVLGSGVALVSPLSRVGSSRLPVILHIHGFIHSHVHQVTSSINRGRGRARGWGSFRRVARVGGDPKQGA